MFHNVGFLLPPRVFSFVDILLQVLIVRYSVLTLLYQREISHYQSSLGVLNRRRAALASEGSWLQGSSRNTVE